MADNLRILHIPAYALHGGCEKNCYHFITNSPQHSHDIWVLDKTGPMSQAWSSLGVDVRHLDILKAGMFAFKNALQSQLKGASYDIVICWSTIRLPLQLHALDEVTSNVKVYLGNPVGKNYNPWKDVLLKTIFSHKTKVKLMACSEYVAVSYRKSPYFSSYPVEVSLNPVEIPSSPRLEPMGKTFVMGMVARLDPIKDHATVIRAFKEVHDKHPDTALHLVGDGKLRKDLEQLTAQLGLTAHVRFHGDVSDVYSQLRNWNLFLYATTPDEGLGSAVAESMANGLPCVLADLPMLRELAPENTASWFAPFDAASLATQVSALMKDPVLRRRMEEQAYAHASVAFTSQRFIESYVNDVR